MNSTPNGRLRVTLEIQHNLEPERHAQEYFQSRRKTWCEPHFREIPPDFPARYQIGEALPDHLVDDGRLMLFFDEQIGSRRPTRQTTQGRDITAEGRRGKLEKVR
ncbi:hypothetical protein F5144DRAFT_552512 [Chaetomium tenue]|uniref:Uncharacterized protein n=1 Tax=Chaetomium tenue TaxID=1854479 RepID=A0ACB7PMR6_9PEZI|nr:hypothetical protein F5144DRAFT_552512 [Chaetomium globosum]